jgi:hypothetical protein
MPLLSISAAARATGKNRATISRHLKEGRVSGTTDSAGNIAVDTAELIRVYGELKSDGTTSKPPHDTPYIAASDSNTAALITTLQQELQAAQEREAWLRERIEHLERLALPQGEVKKSLWARIFGK